MPPSSPPPTNVIGKLLDHLETLGLRDNTLVVFQSDHGHSVEERTFGGGGSAGLYRGPKGNLFEGGIRVPATLLPGHLPEGQVRDQMAGELDWFPTIAELCGIDHAIPDLDGKSLVPLLTDPAAASPHDHYIWQLRPQWAVRQGDWKLLGNPQDPTQSCAPRQRTRRPLPRQSQNRPHRRRKPRLPLSRQSPRAHRPLPPMEIRRRVLHPPAAHARFLTQTSPVSPCPSPPLSATLTPGRPTGRRRFAPVAQLDRVADFESEGCRFESCRAHFQPQRHWK